MTSPKATPAADAAASDDFFTGYSPLPPPSLRPFLGLVAALFVLGFGALSLVLGLMQRDGGDGGFLWDAGPQDVRGIIENLPYPVLYGAPDAKHPQGHAYLLFGDGKRGAQPIASAHDNAQTLGNGFIVKRGALDLMLISDPTSLKPNPSAVPAYSRPATQDLGRWRVRGEICDGKCYAGAMRPGRGLAHKPCANLCIIGGVPPVLITNAPIDGSTHFLLANADGGPMPEGIRDYIASPVDLTGQIERRGDLAIFKVDRGSPILQAKGQ